MNTQNDIYKLEAVDYLAPDNAVALMAKDYADARTTGTRVQSTYLRILVAHSQKALQDSMTATPEQMQEAIKFTHERLYSIVLSAITTPDITHDSAQPDVENKRRALERNRRSNFARSAKSTLIAFVKAGGALPGLKAREVTKESLRTATQTQTQILRSQTQASTMETRLERQVKRMAESNREAAIEFIDHLHTRLMLAVAVPLAQLTTRRGELTLHPSH